MIRIKLLLVVLVVAFLSNTGRQLNAQNKSLLFDGSVNKVVIPSHSDFDFTSEFTLEAWIYAENWKSLPWQGSVINKDSEVAGVQGGYMIRIGGNGVMEGIVTPGWTGVSTGPVMQEKKWNHVAMVFKEGEMWLYVNGSLEAYKGGLPATINKSTANLQIGESPGFPGRVWDGRIDEVRIWNIARSAADIQQNMNVAFEGNESGLVAYYNFDEDNSSSTLTDKTGNGHTGNLESYGSNYTWVNGYELSQNDLAITKVLKPANSPVWSKAEQIQVEIKNVAFNKVSNFDVSFDYNGVTYVENISRSIEPWQTYTHTFSKFIDLSSKTMATIKADVMWDIDTEASNNSVEQSFVKNNKVSLMKRVQHNFGDKGQSHVSNVVLPDDNSEYSQLLLHVKLDCPNTGCDAWDVLGDVKIKKDGDEYEIGRFITPYGKACGPWTIDVSDFRSILKGAVDVSSHILVWGNSGWLLTLELEYVKGELDQPFTKVVPLYELDAQVYGDPNISYDLPVKTVAIPENTVQAQLRMTNTGHGQANTNNAAEFMEANHHFWINGAQKFTHHLWKDDCSSNTCSPQSGTWKYSRAGWCPGQQVNPAWFNLAEDLVPGTDMTIDYVLQDYTNLLNTGYNGGSHTEPFYRIYSYLILSSDSPFESYVDMAVDSIRLIDGSTIDKQNIYVELLNKGSVAVETVEISYLINNLVVHRESITVDLAPGEKSIHKFEIDAFGENESAYVVAYTNVLNDVLSSNNAKGISILAETGLEDLIAKYGIKLYPNPVTSNLNIESVTFMEKIEIKTLEGRAVKEICPETQWVKTNLDDLSAGAYIVTIYFKSGEIVSETIIKR